MIDRSNKMLNIQFYLFLIEVVAHYRVTLMVYSHMNTHFTCTYKREQSNMTMTQIGDHLYTNWGSSVDFRWF